MSGDGPGGDLDDACKRALFSALAAHLDAYVSCIDRERRVLYLNRTWTLDLPDVLGKKLDDFIALPQREAVVARVESAFESGLPQEAEYSIVSSHGERRHFVTRVIPFRGPRGEELALLLTSDVSAPRLLAEQLEESEEFRRRVVENLPDFVLVVDREYRMIWANRIAPQLDPADVIGKNVEQYITPQSWEKAKVVVDAAFESAALGQYEIEGYRDGQTSGWYSVRVVPLISEGVVDNVLLLTADITERKRAELALREAEEQLHRAQRLESLGQLAGGIAHDFNNLLQVIDGNLSFAMDGLEQGLSPTEELSQAMRATERAAELTSHLLAVGRRKRVDSKRVDLGALVAQSVRMLRRAIPENVALAYEPPSAHYVVDLDAPQFEQVLLNLCVNARDAMPQGGVLTIRIEPDGESHVAMSVQDTGMGIAAENLGHVFEPFFTTKGAGSGLGLAVAAGIVAAHGGVMRVESDGKTGTTLTVRLPRVREAPEDPPLSTGEVPPGSGVILVAEDEDAVRAHVQRILQRAGYTVLQANNGARAVELFRQHQVAIDLVLLDVVMPELDGWQAFLVIEALKPDVKVLFTTGYAADVLPQNFAARGVRLLSKPYKPEHLLGQIRELLNRRTPP